MFVKHFQVEEIKRVTLKISGLGYFFFTVNGKRVTDELFTPAQTDYAPRDTAKFLYPITDTLTHKVFYLQYDITDTVVEGDNVLSVVVGNGWFRQTERIAEGSTDYSDTLCAIFDIEIEGMNGKISVVSSDGDEECFVYPILKSNLFLGDVIDTRMFLSDLPKANVFLYDSRKLGNLALQDCPSDRVIRKIIPTKLPSGIYDAGENISGRVVLTVKGRCGAEISVRHAEEVTDDRLDYASSGGGYLCSSGVRQIQEDRYVLNGQLQSVYPEFSYHGFRYFTVEGDCEILSASVEVIHTDLPITSSFSCDNENINWLYDAFLRSLHSNFHGSIPSDCPHRERLGYTGDGQVSARAGMLLMDSKKAYRKWIDDILECQCQKSGHVQHTAPFGGGGGGPGGWGCAIVFVPYQYYRAFGDKTVLLKAYPHMCRWLSYLESRCEGGLLVHEEEGGWCLGDWCAVPDTKLPAEFVNTVCMIKAISDMEEIAAVLGLETNALADKKEFYKRAVYEAFYRDGSYLGGEQGADAYALWAKLLGEGLKDSLIRRYEEKDTFDTGFIATEILCNELFEIGRGDIAIKLMGSDSEEVGFCFMRKHGATTLYECLDTTGGSHNHHMFGGCVHTLFTGLLGIKRGDRGVYLAPCLCSGLAYAEGSVSLPEGILFVRIEKDRVTVDTTFSLDVILPSGTIKLLHGKTVIDII